MTHHDDSMLSRPTPPNNRSKEAPRHLVNTVQPARPRDTDNRHISRNHQALPRLQVDPQAMVSRSMDSDKACSMVCSRAQCSTLKRSKRLNRKDSQRKPINNMPCTAWRNHRRHSRRTTRSRSTGRERTLLNHMAPPIACRNRHNTIWEVRLASPARLHQSSQDSRSLHSICYQTRTRKPVHQARRLIRPP